MSYSPYSIKERFSMITECSSIMRSSIARSVCQKKLLENHRLKAQKPVIESILRWLDRQSTVKGSSFHRTVIYCQNQHPYMMTYLEYAHCSLSNNISENSL